MSCLIAVAGCSDGSLDETPDAGGRPDARPTPPRPPDAPEQVPQPRPITAQGRVVDWATGAPVAGATVELRHAWTTDTDVIATATTTADGAFGPITGLIAPRTSFFEFTYVAFYVRDGGRAQTISDISISCDSDSCDPVSHQIAAPDEELGAAWRTALAAGGMPDADTRALIAFQYLEPTSAPAVGVATQALRSPTAALTPGTEVRFLAADRRTLAPATQATTLASGVALVGIDGIAGPNGPVYLAGSTASEQWVLTGCMNEAGYIFLEDKHGAPPSLARSHSDDPKYPFGS